MGSAESGYSLQIVVLVYGQANAVATFTFAQSIHVYPDNGQITEVLNAALTDDSASDFIKGIRANVNQQLNSIAILSQTVNVLATQTGSNSSVRCVFVS